MSSLIPDLLDLRVVLDDDGVLEVAARRVGLTVALQVARGREPALTHPNLETRRQGTRVGPHVDARLGEKGTFGQKLEVLI